MFRRTNPRFVCMICGAVMAATLYMSSYSGDYKTFAGMYGLMAGIVIGFIYIYPVAHCYAFYPHRRSTVSGIIISASGIGTVIFAFMAYNTINPNNAELNAAAGFYGN
jgi:OFA family oxalate/formate antiporter-like MFS transporter